MSDLKRQLRKFKEYGYSIPVWRIAKEAAVRIEELELEVSRLSSPTAIGYISKINELKKVLEQTNSIASAFLKHFVPANIASDKENQWWAVYDQIDRNEYLLEKLNK